MKKQTLLEKLNALNACDSAQNWVKENKIKTLGEAWTKCPRGDWMLWYAGKHAGSPESKKYKRLVLAACECARLALPYAKSEAVRKCIETVEAWAHGKATMENVRNTRAAAAAAAAAASYAYAAAANAAANAADTDYAAAAAAANAAYTDYAAAAAAAAAANAADTDYAAAAAAARSKTLQQCADIVRKHYPKAPR